MLQTVVKAGELSVNRSLKKLLTLILACCLMISLTQAAIASNTFRTTGGVNLRSGPSTNASRLRTVGPGVSVEVLDHDPAGWSSVRVDGTDGYIRSDFLAAAIGDSPAAFRTTAGVNLRAAPTTGSEVVTTVGQGSIVEVHEHDPAGWSNVSIGGATGYIRSDFLLMPSQSAQHDPDPPAAASQSISFFRTTAGVNFRSAPSTDASIITTVGAGSRVEMLEHNTNGWSRVSVNGTTGYIRSDFLRSGAGTVEFLEWSDARHLIRNGVPMHVVDVRTGISFTLQSFSKGGHADVEPVTRADTEAILRSRNGVWAWAPRPVWVTIGNRTVAAALNGMPHAGSTIPNNGMNGHLCLHFGGTVANSPTYQRDLRNAVMEAWNAAQ
jgi:uncharacterized protein YgiM (DUF1202 family)